MAKGVTFKRNAKNISRILKTWDGGKRQAAQRILDTIDDPDAKLEVYETDREVVGVMVPGDVQAKYGSLTRGMNAGRRA